MYEVNKLIQKYAYRLDKVTLGSMNQSEVKYGKVGL
jgi:hypothetical protein